MNSEGGAALLPRPRSRSRSEPSPTNGSGGYRSTSPIRNSAPLGPYSRTMPRALWKPQGGAGVSYERGTPVGFKVWCSGFLDFLGFIDMRIDSYFTVKSGFIISLLPLSED
jgi:hypothetical protein